MRSTRDRAGLLVAALATGLVTALVTTLLTSYAASAGAAGSDRPAVGECRALRFGQISQASDTTAAIPCSTSHTDRVIKVADLPSGTTWDALTVTQIGRLGITECTPAFRRALGQNDQVRDRSAYAWIFFEPTQAQRDAGANWIRCDLILLKGRALKALPTDAVPALHSSKPSDQVRRCLVGTLHLTTVCTATHDFRATGAFAVKGSYPGNTKLGTIARKRCPALVSTPRRYLFSHPSTFTWNHEHDHAVVCFSHRSS